MSEIKKNFEALESIITVLYFISVSLGLFALSTMFFNREFGQNFIFPSVIGGLSAGGLRCCLRILLEINSERAKEIDLKEKQSSA